MRCSVATVFNSVVHRRDSSCIYSSSRQQMFAHVNVRTISCTCMMFPSRILRIVLGNAAVEART